MNNNPFMPNPNGLSTPAPTPAPTPMPSGNMGGADNFEIDLTEVKDGSRIPNGLYRVRCTEIAQDVSKGGNPMFVWTFVVVDTEHAGFESKVFTALTPAAMWKVAETVVALGVGQQGQVVKFKRSDVLGKECGALIEETEYNGSIRSRISRVMTLAELETSRMAV